MTPARQPFGLLFTLFSHEMLGKAGSFFRKAFRCFQKKRFSQPQYNFQLDRGPDLQLPIASKLQKLYNSDVPLSIAIKLIKHSAIGYGVMRT
jgi:hypothetical protein